jgi:sigma-B regulation protein RsbU (phosphoserine phosphatase)
VENTVQLEQGDSIFLVTDGIVEARSAGDEPFGLDRSVGAIARRHTRGVEEMARSLIDGVTDFAEGEVQHDDMTLLAIQWR